MWRLLQTQNTLYSLKTKKPRFSAQLWKARLQASVKKPDSLVTAATQRLWETCVILRTDKPGWFFTGWKQQKLFSFVSLFFASQFKHLWPHLFCCLWTVSCLCYPPTTPPDCSLAGYSPQLTWRTWGCILSSPGYLAKPQGWVLNLYSSIMKTN